MEKVGRDNREGRGGRKEDKGKRVNLKEEGEQERGRKQKGENIES